MYLFYFIIILFSSVGQALFLVALFHKCNHCQFGKKKKIATV